MNAVSVLYLVLWLLICKIKVHQYRKVRKKITFGPCVSPVFSGSVIMQDFSE